MERMFRPLKEDEIECRIQSVDSKKGEWAILLLYKDARVDQNILDETVGPMNWQRKHLRDNANCVVSIWDKDKSQWIEKEDTGTESNTEQQKGLASDSFKRACFNWGIGRELYTSPLIWFNLLDDERYEQGGKYKASSKARFSVAKIEVKDGVITLLHIKDRKNQIRYKFPMNS